MIFRRLNSANSPHPAILGHPCIDLLETIGNAEGGLITLREPGTKFGFWLNRRNKDGKYSLTVRDLDGVSKGISWPDELYDSWKRISFVITEKYIRILTEDGKQHQLDLGELSIPKDITRIELGHVPGGSKMFSGMVKRLEIIQVNT